MPRKNKEDLDWESYLSGVQQGMGKSPYEAKKRLPLKRDASKPSLSPTSCGSST
jgi:hypothetical protein